jgi:phosphate-selective porin
MKRLILPLLICLFPAFAAQAGEAELQQRIEQLSSELDKLRQELQEMNSRTQALADQQEETMASATRNTSATATAPVSIWGYGEINYNRPTHDSSQTKMDLRRAVLGIGYDFDESTRLSAEFEFEHAVASAEDEGEVEVEQFYIDHSLTTDMNFKAGLFLIPSGLLNLSHEPVYYYGVERNFVETAIIPSTWREGGVGLYGSTSHGIAWDVGVTTGFNLGSWDPASTEGQESPLGSIHQELMKANARDLSTYLALDYRGIPGWVAGASIFTGKAGQGDPAVSLAADARVTLWEAHTRWTPGRFDLTALYARGTISDTAALNLTFAGNPSPIPSEFWGGYLQAAYKFPLGAGRSVSPFVRHERYNTAASYKGLPTGLGVATLPTERVWTYGFNYNLNPHLVFKADYQHFSADGDRNRFDLGMGLDF